MNSNNVFIVTLSDSEIDIVRRAAIMLGKTVTNVLHDFVMEEAERTIEDGEMCSRMARQDMSRTRDSLMTVMTVPRKMPCGREHTTEATSCDVIGYLRPCPQVVRPRTKCNCEAIARDRAMDARVGSHGR